MRNVMRLSTLTQCILLATTSLMVAGNASAATTANQPVVKNATKLETNKDFDIVKGGINNTPQWDLHDKNAKLAAVLEHDAAAHNVYFSGPAREANDQQAVIINGTDLSGKYINMSSGGSAGLMMLPGSKADMIEMGNAKAKTDTTIYLNNAQLNGQQTGKTYDDKADKVATPPTPAVHAKDYMDGAAIWMDPQDNGDLTVVAGNQSVINGSINAKGTGNKSVAFENSALTNGSISFNGESVNNISLKKSDLLPNIDAVNNKIALSHQDAITLSNAKENHVTFDNSGVDGIKNLESSGDSDIFMVNKSKDSGDIMISAGGTAAIDISNSSHKGDIDIYGEKGASIFVTNHATSTGNVEFGAAKNLLTVSDHSTMLGNVIANNTSKTDMVVGNNSNYIGTIAGVKTLSINDHSQVLTSELKDMNIAMRDNSKLVTTNLNHSIVDMSTSDYLEAANVTGENIAVVSQLSAGTSAGTHTLADMKLAKDAKFGSVFSNGKQAVSARNGAYNNDLQLSTVTLDNKSKDAVAHTNTVLSVKRAELASDVKSAIAGLDGAKASAASVTGSIANRMNTLNASNLFYGVHEGASVWGDYLFQNADLKGNTDSSSKLQGLNTGADWTWKLNNGDSLTSGMAIGKVKNKLTHASAAGDFNNHVMGDFYSLYAGWQQALQNNSWSLFANTNVSYGRLNFSANSDNVTSATSGVKEHLNSNYKGNVLNAELRSGVNIKATPTIVVQPYALLGMNKATADEFANSNVKFAKNQTSAWYAGVGTRITTNVDVKSIKLMPWADVSYTQEFNDKTDIKATAATKAGDYQLNSGKSRKVMAVGAGLNAAVTNNLNLNSGIYTNAGDTTKDVSIRAGLNYNF
ncbi:autotransporter outer membrane beta-barrel domain-containing protein [Rouxiella sp. T17]|uniref:autotransporter outer membrane beta-barrel domain-containing protein n=1 Tax=Rouxiella sp. T17 TaxID=3085684 RepID=UPI002FCC30B5